MHHSSSVCIEKLTTFFTHAFINIYSLLNTLCNLIFKGNEKHVNMLLFENIMNACALFSRV